MYLIMKVTPLADQYECDYDREPLRVVKDWITDDLPNGCEVYEINSDGSLTCVKRYEEYLEEGMQFLCYAGPERDTVRFTFMNLTRDDPIPEKVMEFAKEKHLQYNTQFLQSSGYGSFWNDTNRYVYEEYTRG